MKEYKPNPLGKGNNKLFPPIIEVHEDGVKFVQQGVFKSEEFLVPFSEIYDISISTPLIGFASIRIYGGKFSGKGVISGFNNSEVRELKELIELGKKDAQKLKSVLNGTLSLYDIGDDEEEEEKEHEEENDIEDGKEEEFEDKVDDNNEIKEKKDITESAKSVDMSKPSGPPPPPPTFAFYALIDNKQYGPYNKIQFKRLVDNNMVSDKTLVWKEGMDNWAPAKDVPEMDEFFPQKNSSIPPPPPPSPQGPPPPPIG